MSTDFVTVDVSGIVPGTVWVGVAGLSTTSALVQNGRLCVVPFSGSRLGVAAANVSGVLTLGPGLIGTYPTAFPVVSGSTIFLQV